MTKSKTILFVVLALALALATGGVFHLYNTQQEEIRQQAVASLAQGQAALQWPVR